MALDNLITVTFTEAELDIIDQALKTINETLAGKVINLTPEERTQYGSIREENKLLVNKVKDMESNYPEHHPGFLDLVEFGRDYDARQQLESRVALTNTLAEMMSDTKILLDYDNYNYAVAYYRYMKMLAQQNVPGTTSIYENMRQVYESQLAAARAAMKKKAEQNLPEPTPPQEDEEDS